ncbi:MAG: T9SS type A sorting domain-containing protein [Saprospiraceae bacterium]|nr:T9SS type A sorting domain-containing protein [Saprospiraceae bacterium]
MKKSILLTFAMVCLLVTGYSQTDTIWGGANDPNSRFALGLNDWTAMAGTSSTYNVPPDCASNRTPVSTEADPDALWAWDENGMAEEGAFWGSRGPIASPSLADGAAIFNSSFLDNAGSDTNCGGGIAPSPHTGYLVSPTFSCAGHSTVFVRFHQYFRNFVATTTLDVSIDGGTTWVKDTLNGNLQFNDETGNDDVQLVNISAIAANQPNVMIRFTFEGEYYFWIIDDVIVIEQPSEDLTIGDFFFGFNYATPATQITTDTTAFLADVINKGSATINSYRLKVRIVEQESGDVIYQDSITVDTPLAPGDTNTVTLEKTFTPGELPAGTAYDMIYSVEILEAAGLLPGSNLEVREVRSDANPADNIKSQEFVVSNFTYSKDPGTLFATRPADDGDYSMGNVYRTASFWPDNTTFKATEMTVSVARPGLTSLQGFTISVFLLEVADDIAADLSQLNTLPDIGQDNDKLKIIATANHSFTDEANFDEVPIQLLDFETFDPGVTINPNKTYIALVRYFDAAAELLQGFNDQINYFYTSTIIYQGRWYSGGFGPDNAAVIRLRIEMDQPSSFEEVQLPDYTVKIYPNPANTQIRVDMTLDSENDGIVVLADITGRVLDMRSFQGAQNRNFNFDTSKLADGTYIVRVATRDGAKTSKVVVQH